MTPPKEKAKELIDKMHNSEHCGIKHFPNKKYCECVEMNLFQAKQCALIAVDEILENVDYFFKELEKDNLPNKFDDEIEYWNEVKQEIWLIT